MNKRNVLKIITEILVGSASTVGSSTMGLTNLGAGNTISCSTALLTSNAVLITNEYLSKLKIRHTKLREWINVITLLYEKRLNQSMIDKKIDAKKAEELKKTYNHYLVKIRDCEITNCEVEDVFGIVVSRDKFIQEQITKPNNFLAIRL